MYIEISIHQTASETLRELIEAFRAMATKASRI
ncbi:hypothetical protein GGQ18_002940 [Salinibacter ruber]|nr:hypothetical protein [Salinibacter ruber]